MNENSRELLRETLKARSVKPLIELWKLEKELRGCGLIAEANFLYKILTKLELWRD
jgi:hypothetical protein